MSRREITRRGNQGDAKKPPTGSTLAQRDKGCRTLVDLSHILLSAALLFAFSLFPSSPIVVVRLCSPSHSLTEQSLITFFSVRVRSLTHPLFRRPWSASRCKLLDFDLLTYRIYSSNISQPYQHVSLHLCSGRYPRPGGLRDSPGTRLWRLRWVWSSRPCSSVPRP